MSKLNKGTKKLTAITAASLALCVSVGFAGCNFPQKPTPSGTTATPTKFTELKSTQSIYGFSAASAGLLIQSAVPSAAKTYGLKVVSAYAAESDNTTPQDTPTTPDPSAPTQPAPDGNNTELNELDGYMSLVGSLLGNGSFKTEEQTSDRTEYQVKAVVSYPDLAGNLSQYVLYYNEIAQGVAPVVASDDEDEDHESGKGDKQESKEKYSIRGIMVIGTNEYPLEGRRVIETEGNESENKTNLTVTISETDRIEVEQKTEAEEGELEQKFIYSTYKNNALFEKTSFSFESEGSETELKMQTLKDGVTKLFRFDSEVEDGQEKIMIRIGDKSVAKKYRVNVMIDANGLKSYTYTEVGKGSDKDTNADKTPNTDADSHDDKDDE